MLCKIDANQLFFMSEKHVLMANVIFFLSQKGGRVGYKMFIFQWGFIFRWQGPTNGKFQKNNHRVRGEGMPNQL